MKPTLLFILVVAFTFCIGVMGVAEATTISQFNDGTTSGNMTLTGINTITKYLNIPMGADITDVTLYINGYGGGQPRTYSFGNNVTTYSGIWTNGSIGSGYINNPERTNDGNFNNYASLALDPYQFYYRVNFSMNSSYSDAMSVRYKWRYKYAIAWIGCYRQDDPTYVIQFDNASGSTGIYDTTTTIPEPCVPTSDGMIEFSVHFNCNGCGYSMYLYDISVNTSDNYIQNVSVGVNSTSLYNYVNDVSSNQFVNLTSTTLQDFVNLEYPTPITFTSNYSGILEYNTILAGYSGRNYTFNFYDEQDGTVFDLNATNSTTLGVKCPTTYTEYSMSSGTEIINIDCNYEWLKLDVTMNDQANYYRTRSTTFPADESPVIDWYLVNLNNKSVVQIILVLDDLTGYRWSGSTVMISRNVNNTADATIIEQDFDVDNRVYLYLMQDEQYDLTITNSYGETWRGEFIADSAEEKTITLPGTGFGGDNYWERDISINYTFSAPQGVLTMRMIDIGGFTNYANYTILNATNDEVIAFGEYSGDFTTWRTFPYQNTDYIYGNHSYITVVNFNHTVLGIQTQRKVWGDYSGGISPGYWAEHWQTMIKYFTFILLLVVILSFGQKDAHIGLVIVLLLMGVFKKMGWLDWVTGVVLGAIGLITVVNWWRKEEVSPG